MPNFDLQRQAASFANEMSVLLNGSVCDGIRIVTVTRPSGHAVLGYKISKADQDPTQGIPVTVSAKAPSCYLGLSFRLEPDNERKFLAVRASFMGIFVDAHLDRALLHYDYERDKADSYPEAHLQIAAESTAWLALCRDAGIGDRPLQRLHLPVGGRRFRPTLEDLVEFLIVERIAVPRPGWKALVEDGRNGFQRRQLKAAVRRDPEAAEETLRDMGRLPGDGSDSVKR